MPSPSLAELLGIRHAIVLGGMTWVGRHALAAAVSEAGGLGVIGSGGMDADELRGEIRALRKLTDRPFGVNVPLIDVRAAGEGDAVEPLIEVVIGERVPVVVTAAGSARRYTERLHAAGARVVHVVPSPELAQKAEAAGVDAVVAESVEGGGHVRVDGLATFSLVPQVVDAVSIPVIAAGGIVDARGVAAALALGASGVQLGTRFVATVECCAHPAYKQALVEAGPDGAPIYCRDWHASRGLATPVVRRLIEMEREGRSTEELVAYRGRGRAKAGCLDGDVEQGLLPAGSGVGGVREVLTVAELVESLTRGAAEIAAALSEALSARRHDGPGSRKGAA